MDEKVVISLERFDKMNDVFLNRDNVIRDLREELEKLKKAKNIVTIYNYNNNSINSNCIYDDSKIKQILGKSLSDSLNEINKLKQELVYFKSKSIYKIFKKLWQK